VTAETLGILGEARTTTWDGGGGGGGEGCKEEKRMSKTTVLRADLKV